MVARVNDEAIERWEVDAAVREITLANLHPLPQAERDELVRAVLDRIIEHHLASQIARARGVAATDAEVDEDLRQLRREPMFDERLKTAGVSPEQLRHQRRLSLDMAKLVRAAATPMRSPTPRSGRITATTGIGSCCRKRSPPATS